MSNNLIEISNLEKTFVSKGEVLTVLKDLNLDIPQNKKITIVGQSGNGKSTLLNIISGNDVATSGVIKIENKIILSTIFNIYISLF